MHKEHNILLYYNYLIFQVTFYAIMLLDYVVSQYWNIRYIGGYVVIFNQLYDEFCNWVNLETVIWTLLKIVTNNNVFAFNNNKWYGMRQCGLVYTFRNNFNYPNKHRMKKSKIKKKIEDKEFNIWMDRWIWMYNKPTQAVTALSKSKSGIFLPLFFNSICYVYIVQNSK